MSPADIPGAVWICTSVHWSERMCGYIRTVRKSDPFGHPRVPLNFRGWRKVHFHFMHNPYNLVCLRRCCHVDLSDERGEDHGARL